MTQYNVTLKAKELKLGDVVKVGEGSYLTATVIKIKHTSFTKLSQHTVEHRTEQAGLITFFRPYVHTSDVETTAGITPYIGFEQFEVYADSDRRYFCYEHDNLIK